MEHQQIIIDTAQNDSSFMNQLIANPRQALKDKFPDGPTILEEYNIVVEDQTSTDYIYFNIPKRVNIDDLELSDEDLEMVSGGLAATAAAGTAAAAAASNILCAVCVVVVLGAGIAWGMYKQKKT